MWAGFRRLLSQRHRPAINFDLVHQITVTLQIVVALTNNVLLPAETPPTVALVTHTHTHTHIHIHIQFISIWQP